MDLNHIVIHSKLIPPRFRGTLRRPRLTARLAEILEFPLTIVQAETGYGKTTELAALSGQTPYLFWYTITEPDCDPVVFLAHLMAACSRAASGGDRAMEAVREAGGRVSLPALIPLLNSLTANLHEEAILVLDDYHYVLDVPEINELMDQLLEYLPPHLHLVISTRRMPAFSSLNRHRVKGRVMDMVRRDLAFTVEEIELLFLNQFRRPISRFQAERLLAKTEGWAIALQMVWQALQSDDALDLDKVLERFPATMTSLYEYLAQEVLDRQPEELRSFLLSTSVLRQMDAPACCAVSGTVHSSDHLHRLHENGLFVDSVGGEHFRYQGLFHEFLLAQLQALPDASRGLHQKAAAHYLRVGNSEEAVYHLLESGDYDEAARTVIELGPGWIQLGRLDSLTGWIARLPDDVHTRFPTLLLMKGDTSRLRSQFAEALEQYSQAERCFALQNHRVGRSKALQGQAQVYLDTIRPLKADSLLEEAIRLLEPQEFREMVSGLLDQLAENKLNLGHPEQARALHHEAGLLRSEADPGDIYLEARALLRTGKLEKARQLLQARADEESRLIQVRPPRFHRETLILLSLVCIMMGDAETAGRCARQGIAIGQRIESPFVEAVGLMRLGHTCQLDHLTPWSQQERLEAIRLYYQAIEKVRVFNVMRVQVEPLWGLCRVYGYQGDLDQAESFGWRAVEIAEQAGDRWFVNLLLCTMGASLALAGKVVEARERLAKAVEGFEGVKDTFGQSAALLWLSLNSWWHGDIEEAMHSLAQLLPIARREGYDFLLTRCTHLGLKDDQQALPLLIEAGRRGIEQKYCSDLLQRLNLTGVEYHPGHTLVVRTLGRFEVRKADLPITPHEWQREKARQLFQLILTERGRWLQKEQIVDRLWPDLPPDAAARDLKVALNALNHTLEPNRPQRAQSFFIARQENQYGLNPQAHVLVDTEEMDRLASSTEPSSLRQALCLYGGEYLPDSVYGDWSEAARQRYRNLYLTTAERLAKSLAEQKCWDEVISLAENILKVDAHWEPAYILLMRAYAADHNRGQVYNTYRRCKAVLHEDLDIEPAAVTQAIYKELTE